MAKYKRKPGTPHPKSSLKPKDVDGLVRAWGVSRGQVYDLEALRIDLEDAGVPSESLRATFADPKWVKSKPEAKMAALEAMRPAIDTPATDAPAGTAPTTPSKQTGLSDADRKMLDEVRAAMTGLPKGTLKRWEEGKDLASLRATHADLPKVAPQQATPTPAADAVESNVPADPQQRVPSGEASNLPEPVMGRDGQPIVVQPSSTVFTQSDVMGSGLPTTQSAELPEAVTPTPSLSDLMPEFTGAATPGKRRGVTPEQRAKLWDAYSKGSIEVDGKKSKILAAAQKRGIATDDQAAFDAFVSPPSKPTTGGPVPGGVEVNMVDPGSPMPIQPRTESFVGVDPNTKFREGSSGAKPQEAPTPQEAEPPKPVRERDPRVKRPMSDDPESPFYNVNKPRLFDAVEYAGQVAAATPGAVARNWPGLVTTGLTVGIPTGMLIRYLMSDKQQAPQQPAQGQPTTAPQPSLPTGEQTYRPPQFQANGVRAALERKRPTDIYGTQGQQ